MKQEKDSVSMSLLRTLQLEKRKFCVLQFRLVYRFHLVVGKGVGHVNCSVFMAFERLYSGTDGDNTLMPAKLSLHQMSSSHPFPPWVCVNSRHGKWHQDEAHPDSLVPGKGFTENGKRRRAASERL